MPEILKNTVSGACTIDGKQVNSWYEDYSIADWAESGTSQRLAPYGVATIGEPNGMPVIPISSVNAMALLKFAL